jgi:integrase
MTLQEFFDFHYSPLRLRGRSENTTRLYGCTLRSFAKFLGRTPTLEDLDDLTVSRFLAARAKRVSPFTAEKERTQLLSLARFSFDRGLRTTRPCVPPAPLPERVPTAWSIESIRSVMAAAANEQGVVCGTPAGLYFRALVAVLWETAERVGAILSLQVADFSDGRILVRAENRKGRKRDKLYSLTPETSALLAEACKGKKPSDLIFRWHKQRTNLWYAFGRIVKRAGLEGGRRAKFHQLRRSSATHFAAGGGDATALLDHSSPRVTRAYLDPRFLKSGPQPCDVLPKIGG